MADTRTEFIITLKVTVEPDPDQSYRHPAVWAWARTIQRRVTAVREVEVLNCSPLQHEDETRPGWSEEIDRQREEWEEERG